MVKHHYMPPLGLSKHSSLGSVHSGGLGLEFEHSYYRQERNHQNRFHETFIKKENSDLFLNDDPFLNLPNPDLLC